MQDSAHSTSSALADVQRLYHDNQYLKAWARAQALGPVSAWKDVDTLLIGGRLIRNLGAGRMGRILHAKAWRQNQNHPEAVYFNAWVKHDLGPWPAWRFMKKYGELPQADDDLRADWFALLAQVSSDFRDFDSADQWIARALKLRPNRAWIHISHAYQLHAQDRYEESLAAAGESLRLRPHYRPAVQHTAHLLTLVGRDEDAIALLNEATQHIESGDVWAQLGGIHSELGRHDEALKCYQRYMEMAPLLDKYGLNSARASLANQHYLNCDVDKALELSKQIEHSTFFKSMAERLEALRGDPDKSTGLKRVQLPVAFVRQHHMTCAPATLAALCRFWSKPVDHLELAEEICYDGTPHHSERKWAQENGWVAHEFTVDWATTQRLIDRGVPFTATTVETASAHMQAIIGYDAIRETVLIRDPYDRHVGEASQQSFFERYRSTGPRGMVLLPKEKEHLLEGIDLPDAGLFCHDYSIFVALKDHDRRAAQAACDALEQAAPDHLLTLRAKRVLAGYDGDQVSSLKALEKLLERFPRDAGLVLQKLSLLQYFNRRDERVALLKEICSLTPAKNKEDKGKGIHDPVFWEMLAREMRADARERDMTLWLIRRYIEWRYSDASGYNLLAGEYWDLGRFDEAQDLYRFAACLREKEEHHQQTYFTAMRYFKKEETALELMRARVKRWGAQNSLPAQTLHWAYNQLERATEGDAVLEEALKLHPKDGDLLLYTARSYATTLKRERALELLRIAEGCSFRGAWLRTAAFLARLDGELTKTTEIWKEVLTREPIAIDAYRALARVVAETEGVKQAEEMLRAAIARFPANYPLHQLLTEWLRRDPEAQEAALRELLQIHPADGWAHREHALVLSTLRRHDEAEAAARHALQLEPRASSSHCILGEVLAARGDMGAAAAAYRAALEISIDYESAISGLVNGCSTNEEKRAALAFIHEQIVRQTIFGESLLSYYSLASRVLDSETLLARLRDAHAARPDLWQTWSVLVRHLTDMGRLKEAEALAREAASRYPLHPRIWLDLAEVLRLDSDRIGREDALRKALAINPSWSYALRCLAQIYEDELNYAETRKILENACTRDPLDAVNSMYLATVLWKLNEREAAIEKAQHALRIDNTLQWAWDTLREWGEHTGRPGLAVELARKLTESRPGDARNWLTLARILPERRECLDEGLRALDRVLELEPRNTDAFDLKAVLLSNAARFDEARAACNAPVWNGTPPSTLQGRAAWVEAERGDKPGAIELMRRTLELDPQYVWGWHRMAEWCTACGDKKGALNAADSIVRLLPSESMSYGCRAQARLDAGDSAGAHQDLERALQIRPDYLWAGRRLVDLYLTDGKWDEAERIVTTLRSHAPTDAFTIARQAQIDARRRRVDRLLTHLKDLLEIQVDEEWPLESTIELATQFGQRAAVKKLLEETTKASPDYYGAWQQYANLIQDNPLTDEYLEACRSMVRIRPQSYVSYGYLAFAYKERGQSDDAIHAFEEAFKLDPRYGYAANHLFDHYEEKKPEEARRILRVMLDHTPTPRTYLRAIRFYCKQKDEAEATAAFQRLVRCVEDPENAVKPSLDAMANAGWARKAMDALEGALKEESTNPSCGTAWVQWTAEKKDWAALEASLDGWDWSREHTAQGVREYIMTLARQKLYPRLKTYIPSRRERLRAKDQLWGIAGWAYVDMDDFPLAYEWMSDWKERPAAPSWMLINAAIAARETSRDEVAHAVSLQAARNAVDSTTAEHEIWLAWDEANNGAVDSARQRLSGTDFTKLREYYKMLHLLTQALCEVSRLSDPAARANTLETLRTCVKDARAASPADWYSRIIARFVGTIYKKAYRASPSLKTGWWVFSNAADRLLTKLNSIGQIKLS